MNISIRKILCTLFAATMCFTSFAHGQTDDAAARKIPWSGYWFPTAKGELLEPLRKYDTLTGRNALRWELSRNPPGANVPAWHGYCHGWAAASILEQEPTQQFTAAGSPVSIGVADQKGWFAACHSGDAANWFGDRYGDGKGSEDPADLRPEMLWQLLKMFIKDQGVPLIMDLDPGPEVWNYPVYAYRIEYQPHPRGNGWNMAQLSLWAADDAVPPDFVGLMPHFQTYTFEFLTRGRAVVAGSASWVGQSVQDHPDFAWYPYVVRSDNPELQYQVVRTLIQGGSPSGLPSGSPSGPPSSPHTPSNLTANSITPYIPGFNSPYGKPRPTGASPMPSHGPIASSPPTLPTSPLPSSPAFPQTGLPAAAPQPTIQPPQANPNVALPTPVANPNSISPNIQPAATAQPAPQVEPIPVSPMQLVAAVANRTSQFELDIRAAEFGKTQYAIGDRLQLAGTCSQGGYFYVLHVDPAGELTLLYPKSTQDDNRVPANTPFRIALAGGLEVEGPLGNHFVKAIVTRQPLILTGLTHELQPANNDRPWRGRPMRICPTQTRVIKSLLHDYAQGKDIDFGAAAGDIKRWLPEFAQDEFVYYVGPAKE